MFKVENTPCFANNLYSCRQKKIHNIKFRTLLRKSLVTRKAVKRYRYCRKKCSKISRTTDEIFIFLLLTWKAACGFIFLQSRTFFTCPPTSWISLKRKKVTYFLAIAYQCSTSRKNDFRWRLGLFLQIKTSHAMLNRAKIDTQGAENA